MHASVNDIRSAFGNFFHQMDPKAVAEHGAQETLSTLIGEIDPANFKESAIFRTMAAIFIAIPAWARHLIAGALANVVRNNPKIPDQFRIPLVLFITSIPQGFQEILDRANLTEESLSAEFEKGFKAMMKKEEVVSMEQAKDGSWDAAVGTIPTKHLIHKRNVHDNSLSKEEFVNVGTMPHIVATFAGVHQLCPACFKDEIATGKVVIESAAPKPPEKPKPGRLARLSEIEDPAQRKYLLWLLMECEGEIREDWFHGLEGWALPIAKAIVAAVDADPKALAQNMRTGNDLPDLEDLITKRRKEEEAFKAALARGETPEPLEEFNLLHIAQQEIAAVLLVNEGTGGKVEERARQLRNMLDPIWSIMPAQSRVGGVRGVVTQVAHMAGRVTEDILRYTYGFASLLGLAFLALILFAALLGGIGGSIGWVTGDSFEWSMTGWWIGSKLIQLAALAIFFTVIGASSLFVLFGGYSLRWPREEREIIEELPPGVSGPTNRPEMRRVWRMPIVGGKSDTAARAVMKLAVVLSIMCLWLPFLGLVFAVAALSSSTFDLLTLIMICGVFGCFVAWDVTWRLIEDLPRYSPTKVVEWAKSINSDKVVTFEKVTRTAYPVRATMFTIGIVLTTIFSAYVIAGFAGLEVPYILVGTISGGLMTLFGSYWYSKILLGNSERAPKDLVDAKGHSLPAKHRVTNLKRAFKLLVWGSISSVVSLIIFAIFDPFGLDGGVRVVESMRNTRVWVWSGIADERETLARVVQTNTDVRLSSLNRQATAAEYDESACRVAQEFIHRRGEDYCDGAVLNTYMCEEAVRCGYVSVDSTPSRTVYMSAFIPSGFLCLLLAGILALIAVFTYRRGPAAAEKAHHPAK